VKETAVKFNYGEQVEDIIEEICSNTFFSDFTVRSPKYKKANGQEKEIADILIPFDDTLIAFQIKTKVEDKSIYDRSNVDIVRIERRVEETVKQFKTTIKAFEKDKIKDLISVRSLPLPFNKNIVSTFFCIAIVDIIEDVDNIDDQTGVFCPITYINDIPIHVFMGDEFEILMDVVDTLPDFVEYISMREKLKPKLPSIAGELDILALYKLNPNLILECIDGKCDTMIITPDMWDGYEPTHRKILEEKKTHISKYFIDHIIEILHTTVGYTPPIKLPDGPNLNIENQEEMYLEIAQKLCCLNRVERTMIGEKFIEKLVKADKIGYSYCFISNSNKTGGILFYSTNDERQKRVEKLYQLSASAYSILELDHIIGITTESLSIERRSYDFLMFDGVNFNNKDELVEWGQDIFNLNLI